MKKKTIPSAASEEATSFQLLLELQGVLATVLNSLGGKHGTDLYEHFLFSTSAYINRAAEGFIALRKSGRLDASKLLVRPAIEMMFKQQAVVTIPELLYRIAYTERMEDRKLIEPTYRRAGKDYNSLDQQQWRDFSEKYSKQFPNHQPRNAMLSLFDIAKAAGLESYYNSCYRLYCQFTHGAFRVTVGGLNFSDAIDNRTVALCVLGSLEVLNKGKIANIPELARLRQMVSDLGELNTKR